MRSVLWNIETLERYTFTRLFVKALLVVVCALTLAMPLLFRSKSTLLYGFEAYFHLTHGPVSLILSFFSYVLHVDVFLVAKILPIVLGVISLLLFFKILKMLGFRYWLILFACLILIFSPGFIFLFATLTDFTFVSFLFLIIVYLLLRKKEVPALVVFYLIPFFGILNLFLASLLLLIYSWSVRKFRLLLYAVPSFAVLLFSNAKNLSSFGSFISDFGGPFGIGVFIIILSFFGLKYFWKEKYTHFHFYLAILVLVLFAFFNLRVLSYLNFFLALLSAVGLELLFERHWRSKVIKSLTLIILMAGLFISSWSYMDSVINGLPNQEVVDGLYVLGDLSGGNVFSHPSREYWVNFAGKPFVSDNALLYTRDIEVASNIIESKGISYIWIDNDMKSMVWVEEDQGLLFLLKYSKDFIPVYSNDYVTIWKFEKGVME